MTRKEETERASVDYQMSTKPMAIGGSAFSDLIYRANINPSFVAGAQWADKTMINKACKWIDEHILEYVYAREYGQGVCIDGDWYDEFHKAMEE